MEAYNEKIFKLKLLIIRSMQPGKECRLTLSKEGQSILDAFEQEVCNHWIGSMMSQVYLKAMFNHMKTCDDHAAVNPGEIAEAIKGMDRLFSFLSEPSG